MELEVLDQAAPGVIATLWAEGEDGGAALMDVGDGADLGDSGGDDDVDVDLGDTGGGEDDQELDEHGNPKVEEKIDGRRGSKEYRDALKAWEATPEGAKFAKTAKSDHFRVQEITAIEPGGVTAMREKYALLESVGGPEAITSMQERIAETDAVDAALAAGDPKALEALGPDFDPGLAKLTPTILDRVMKSDPAAYAAALLPHLMSGLAGSPMVSDLNRMVDILQAPHLDEKAKLQHLTQALGRIGQWFDANEKKAGELKTLPADKQAGEFEQQRTKFEQEQQAAHWENKILPPVASYEKATLEELYKPYANRLKLDAAAKADLFDTFKAKMKAAGQADAAYMKQMAIYRKQKNPDPGVVANFVKSAIKRHAKAVVDGAVTARYGRFLGAKPGAQQQKGKPVAGARTQPTVNGKTPTIVAARPSPDQVDYSKTSEEDQWKGIYTLKNGNVVKVVKR
jgi:hypothetical protein